MTARMRPSQENDSVPLGPALLLVLLAVLISAAAVGGSVLIAGRPARTSAVPPPPPAATTMPEQSLIEATERGVRMREAQRAALEEYRWVDRDAGLVSIPVERAIDLAAEGAP